MSAKGKHKNKAQAPTVKTRYGIGEWYGRSFVRLAPEQRQEQARVQGFKKERRPKFACPFRSTPESQVLCTKAGGVCSLRRYQLDEETQGVSWPTGRENPLVTTCPHRFKQGGFIFNWIGETLLGCPKPLIVSEVGFLGQESMPNGDDPGGADAEDVGRIDSVLVHPSKDPLSWAALEIQAVYFSGPSISRKFAVMARSSDQGLPFPVGIRTPDYRSSGPKRLMPQLQASVLTV